MPPTDGGSALLHASDVRYMNDSGELRFGANLMIKRLRADASTHNDDFAEVFGQLAELLTPGLFDQATRHLRVFTACFCKKGDLLSQWRGYGGGVGGFAIGFPAQVLLNRAVSLIGKPFQGGAPQSATDHASYLRQGGSDGRNRQAPPRPARGAGPCRQRNGKPAIEWLLGGVYRLLARIKHAAFEGNKSRGSLRWSTSRNTPSSCL